jgi:hypothetical protein
MPSKTRPVRAIRALAPSCLVLVAACSGGESDPGAPEPPAAVESASASHREANLAGASGPTTNYPSPGGQCQPSRPFDPGQFEFIPIERLDDIVLQRLPRPTPLGEDLAVHVHVPPTPSPDLEDSLIRVAGSQEAPIVLFNSDALAETGELDKSPGPGFFTAFARTDERGLELRQKLEEEASRGETNKTALVFEGRHVVALTSPVPFDLQRLEAGDLVGLGRARLIPISTRASWEEALFITDRDVVTDPGRTHDTCTNQGNSCGPWTFCHLMTEMASTARTGITPEAFTRQWLQQWMSDYTVNGDTVARRTAMMTQVIGPWLAASGGAQLDLRKAPFRLLAIVNRLDLRQTSAGFHGYGGSGGGVPRNGGELRFVFGVMRPSQNGTACEPMPFTVIFEYGVPISGCEGVREWANRWTALDAMGGFGPAYRAALESITESIVVANAEPTSGNGSAINQIRTNEIALARPWELREFTLNNQSLSCSTATDVPADGFLRPHTVAQTPDDAAHAPTANLLVDEYVNQEVVPPAPPACAKSYVVPPRFDCAADPVPFLGGNSLADLNAGGSPPGAWLANTFSPPATSEFVCGRHTFSLNTCNGCHACDTATTFTHVNPLSGIPAALSGFLTGELVPDTQFPGVTWSFNDLDRRYQDLYDVAGSQCSPFIPVIPDFFPKFEIDPAGPIIRDIARFEEIFLARPDFSRGGLAVDPVMDDFAAPEQNFSH